MKPIYALDPNWTKTLWGGYEKVLSPHYLVMPKNFKRWYEPFGGSLAFSLNLPKHSYNKKNGDPEIFTNDILPTISKIVTVLKYDFQRFTKIINHLVYSKNLFSFLKEKKELSDEEDLVLSLFSELFPNLWKLNKTDNSKKVLNSIPDYIKDLNYMEELSRRLNYINYSSLDWIEFMEKKVKKDRGSLLILDPPMNFTEDVWNYKLIDYKLLKEKILEFEKAGGDFLFSTYSSIWRKKLFPEYKYHFFSGNGLQNTYIVYNEREHGIDE